MKKFVFILYFGTLCGSIKSQSYVPIDCWGIDQIQINTAPVSWEFTNVNCIESEGNVSVTGPRIMSFRADNLVHLGPGFNASGFTGGGSFHAYIHKGDFEPVIYHPIDSPGEVGKWEKIEVGVPLPGNLDSLIGLFISNNTEGLNPFDPEQIRIEGNFEFMAFPHLSDSAFSQVVDGFYYRDFVRQPDLAPENWWGEVPTDHHFRIRYAPSHLGTYKCTVKIYVNGVLTYTANPFQFKCIPSSNKGPLVYGNLFATDKRHRYLKYLETDEMYFPIGPSIYWKDLDSLKIWDHSVYESWLQKIHDNGGNYAAISAIPWTFGVEWEKLNNYYDRMPNAWELDQLVESAESKGIYLNLLTLIHDDLQNNTPWHSRHYWSQNPYNSSVNGGRTGASNPNDFLTDADCRKYFKFRLRYLMARYGYSVNLPIIELLSEIDNAISNEDSDASVRIAIKDWFTEMRNYIRTDRGYKYKMVSGSYTQGVQTENVGQRIFSEADIVLLHHYGNDKPTNFSNRYEAVNNMLNSGPATNKPVIFDEMGGNTASGGDWTKADYCSDNPLHNNTWATAFMGCFGAGQYWNWHIFMYQGYEDNFSGLATFLQGESFSNDKYRQERWTDNEWAYNENTKYEAFYLREDDDDFGSEKAIGWLHNTSFWWGSLGPVNPCIGQCISDNAGINITGLPFSVADNVPYRDLRDNSSINPGDTSITYYGGYEFKVPDLIPLTNYEIEWYYTHTGLSTGLTDTDISSAVGVAKFNIPGSGTELTPNYGDFGFKIRKLNTTSMIIQGNDSNSIGNQIKVTLDSMLVRIYPNPASDRIYLDSDEIMLSAEIYTMQGELIDQFNINNTEFSRFIRLDRGCYFVRVHFLNTRYKTFKLTIIK